MKTIFLISTILSLQLKAELPVENHVVAVDKEYQYQLVCKAFAANQEFEMNVKWKNKIIHDSPRRAPFYDGALNYELKNVSTGDLYTGDYHDYVKSHTNIVDSFEHLSLYGSKIVNTRLALNSEASEIYFEKHKNQFNLLSIKITKQKTFFLAKDYCDKPMSKLCGSEPINNGNKIILDLVFENSTCDDLIIFH